MKSICIEIVVCSTSSLVHELETQTPLKQFFFNLTS